MFRFTIRDVLWLMVVVGMALAWWVNIWVGQAIYREHSKLWEELVTKLEAEVSALKAAKPPAP